MKKLAIIGMVFAGLILSSASAWATPTGTTKYGPGQYSQQAIIASKLGEIGAWAVPSPQQTDTTPLVSEKLAGLDVGTPTPTATSGEGFDWNDAGIGAALALGFVVLGVGSLLTVRQQHKPIPH